MLNNVTTGSVLTAQSHTAEATSEPITQLIVNEDYRKAKDMRAWFNLPSLTNQTDVDTFKTQYPVQEGDKLVVNHGGSYDDFIIPAGALTPATDATLIPVQITGLTSYGIISCSYNEPDVWRIFNLGYSGSEVYFGNNSNIYITIELPEAKTVKNVYVQFDRTEDFQIQASANGVDWVTIHTGTLSSGNVTIATPAAYTHYRLYIVATVYYVRQFILKGDGYDVNTSTLTAGATPAGVYRLPDLQVNEVPLVEDTTTRFMTGTTTATAAIRYNDITIIPSRTVETNIKFNKYKNQLTEFTKYLYEIDLDRGNLLHTSNIAPANTISVEGTNAPAAVDAYLAFDGTTDPALTIATDGTGVVDISHIYEFDTPITIYKLQTDYGLAIEAPKEYTVSGSFDGITYTELLSVSQDVAIDDLSLTRSFDITKYDAYKFYKIHITLGNPSSNISFKQYTLLKESDVDVF